MLGLQIYLSQSSVLNFCLGAESQIQEHTCTKWLDPLQSEKHFSKAGAERHRFLGAVCRGRGLHMLQKPQFSASSAHLYQTWAKSVSWADEVGVTSQIAGSTTKPSPWPGRNDK